MSQLHSIAASPGASTVKTAREVAPPAYSCPGPEVDLGYAPLDPEHEDWVLLKERRQQAWDLGVEPEELDRMQSGRCPAQITAQFGLLQTWIDAHQAELAA